MNAAFKSIQSHLQENILFFVAYSLVPNRRHAVLVDMPNFSWKTGGNTSQVELITQSPGWFSRHGILS